MSTLRVIITTFLSLACFCQKDSSNVASFYITTSSDSGSGTEATVILTLSWNLLQYKCIITNGIEANSSYGCGIETAPKAALIPGSLSNKEYTMKIELIGDTSDLMKIAEITVYDEDKNSYNITSFCLPSQFANTAAATINVQSLQCCYWSQRLKYDNFAMGNQENAALTISYVVFRSDVINHKNEANEGAVKPPKITKFGIRTLSTNNAGSLSTFNIKLHWDTDEYIWDNLIPSEKKTTYTTSSASINETCGFLSGFNLKISGIGIDSVGIDSIIACDESNVNYTIDTFCSSDSNSSISSSQKYAPTKTECSNNDNIYAYDGFLYNASQGSVYFMWQNSLFLNVNQMQQALVMNDYTVLGWLHSYTCNDVIAPYSKVTIHMDDMDDADNTGWSFSGDHRATVHAVSCPGGASDPCASIAGGGTMQLSLDISEYVNIVVQYEMRLSSMPSGTGCYLFYAFDGGNFVLGQFKQSSSTVPVLYHNQSFTVPAHTRHGYTSLSIRFLNDATAATNYCFFDDFYVFGDHLIQYDGDANAWISSWTLNSSSWVTSTSCPYGGECLALTGNAYAIKRYNNTQLYSNMVVTLDVTGSQLLWMLRVYYAYDDDAEVVLSSSSNSSATKQIFNVPDADTCDTALNIKFVCVNVVGAECYVDNIKLSGTVLQTMNPTYSPTNKPTAYPTAPSEKPTSNPTLEPITPYPTIEPTTFAPTKPPVTTKSGEDKSESNAFVIIFIVLLLIIIPIVLFIWWYKKRKKIKVPGADLGEPLLNIDRINFLNKNNDNNNEKESMIELKNVAYAVHVQPGAVEGIGKGHGEWPAEKDEFCDGDSRSSGSGSDLARDLQARIERRSAAGTGTERGSVGTDHRMSDDLKEAEIIDIINETPQ